MRWAMVTTVMFTVPLSKNMVSTFKNPGSFHLDGPRPVSISEPKHVSLDFVVNGADFGPANRAAVVRWVVGYMVRVSVRVGLNRLGTKMSTQ